MEVRCSESQSYFIPACKLPCAVPAINSLQLDLGDSWQEPIKKNEKGLISFLELKTQTTHVADQCIKAANDAPVHEIVSVHQPLTQVQLVPKQHA